jgi:hypothetical protein
MSRIKKHRARVRLRGRQYLLGRFETPQEARAAYLAGARVKALVLDEVGAELVRLREVERRHEESIRQPQRKGAG